MRTISIAIAITLGARAGAQVVEFHGLGRGPNPHGWSISSCVNSDGTVVGGWATAPGIDQQTPYVAFRWTAAGGLQEFGPIFGLDTSYVRALSADGSVMTGMAAGGQGHLMHAWRWTAADGAVPLGQLPGDNESDAPGLSADGSVVALNSYIASRGYHVARWTAQTGFFDISWPVAQTYAWAISADGRVIVGWFDGGGAYRWTSADGIQPIPGNTAMALNSDGSVVTGTTLVNTTPITYMAFRWTAAGGSELLIDDLGTSMQFGEGVSADGRTVVGAGQPLPDQPDTHAMYWSRGLGLVDLNTYLPARGADLTGWILTDSAAISSDGRTVVGTGLHNSLYEAWLAHIPRCGSADFNDDGDSGTDSDIEAFFACLAGSCCPTCGSPDFNDDGETGTDADIEAFFRVLAGRGC